MKHLLIDGDQFVHHAAAAIEHETRWDDENHVLFSNENKAWDVFLEMINRILERFETIEFTLCFSAPRPYFREAIWPHYKAKRGERKPLCFRLLKEIAHETYKCQSFPGLEGDDVMGILATQPGKETIIVSQDKDMRTIPATVWDGKVLYTYTERQADYWHLWQTLVGDASDGYQGCPGIGAVRASRLLDEADEAMKPLWPVVVAAYAKANIPEETAITEARLARILRWSDWDRAKKQPILWNPPEP